jgi:mxaC protein
MSIVNAIALLFFILAAIALIYFERRSALGYSAFGFFGNDRTALRLRVAEYILLGFVSLAAALALFHPSVPGIRAKVWKMERDFFLLGDFSSSMDQPFSWPHPELAPSENPVPKGLRKIDIFGKIGANFVRAHPRDRIGIGIFDTYMYPIHTLTLSHDDLLEWLEAERDSLGGTEIPAAIIKTVRLMVLRGGSPGARGIILFSDGEDMAVPRQEQELIKLLKDNGIHLYWIRVKSPGREALRPGTDREEISLKYISEVSGGGTWTATSSVQVGEAFAAISKLAEKPVLVDAPPGSSAGYVVFVLIATIVALVLFAFKTIFEVLS